MVFFLKEKKLLLFVCVQYVEARVLLDDSFSVAFLPYCVCGGYTSIVVWVGTMCVREYAHMWKPEVDIARLPLLLSAFI